MVPGLKTSRLEVSELLLEMGTETLWLLLLLLWKMFFSPLFVEAIAAREGLVLAAERGLHDC